ncbi:sodium/proton antiporter NhaB [Aquimarina sp. RZ0]|uniref:sodium/proton antiporter NhaB n=1 Tax=Aquimarina sp. RZ0 TaxID=2607730 RepID=UPI002714B535|nr:sodium/proton antiporter NhaB [Aquimarina sp. RZ0]
MIMLKYFLGNSPKWFKAIMIGFLICNVIIYLINPTICAWVFIGEFIFTLAMALKCYPLQSGGLLAIEILALNLTTPENAYTEVEHNLEVVLLLVFMVAGIYFMKPLLMYIFSKAFTRIKSKMVLSLLFAFLAAVLSAFLDALTVTAVLISVAVGFYGVYHKIHSMSDSDFDQDGTLDRKELSGDTLEQFRSFLRSLVMHGVVGTALGGVCTLVGEPQNLLIGERMGWDFIEFFLKMAPISLPVLAAGLVTTIVLELTGSFGFGAKLPEVARRIIENYTDEEDANRSDKSKYGLIVQAVSAILLIIGLALHLAPVGFIGLALIIVQTAFMGITEEHHLGKAFEEALPFTGLLVVFFVIVAMIHDQHLFTPIIDWALSLDPEKQPSMFYVANGVLSMISDNVFVATVYIGEVKQAFDNGVITREQFEKLAIAINTGTNLPSVATPNGQAAFLFLLTSSLAPLIGLSYGRMVKMALPYTIVLGGIGLLGIIYIL